MMIPYGYKQTEVGVIPEDWECVKIKDVAIISMCKRIFANQTSTIGDVPFYKIGTFGKEADAYISNKLYVEYRNKFSFPQKGDVLISAAGTLGRTVVYDGEKAYFQDSNIVWLDINKTRLCNEYLNQYYKVIKWASSEGSTIARLYNGIIYATYISLPPLQEQQRIAEALSDVDGMISSLEKLIAKYKSIKTACLQQMFPQNGETVPRMRFPGFTDAWEQRRLDTLSVVSTGYPFNSNDFSDSGRYVVITNGNIQDESTVVNNSVGNHISITDEKIILSYLLDIGDILVTMDGTVGRTAKVAYNGQILAQRVGRIKAFGNKEFLYQWLSTGAFSKDMTGLSHGGTIKHISLNEIRSFEATAPENPEEQEKIGEYLFNLDNLIVINLRKLEKVQKIKQGMMQQLLTGKIRLV